MIGEELNFSGQGKIYGSNNCFANNRVLCNLLMIIT